MAVEVEVKRRSSGGGGGLAFPFVPFRIPLPNPLSWRPPLPGFGRRQKKHKGSGFASTSVATISDATMASSSAASATLPPAAAPKVALKPASDVFAGALARAASQSTIHPLDTLKVRLQTAGRTGGGAGPPKVVRMAPPPGLSKIGQLVPPPAGGAVVLAPLAPAFDGRAALAGIASLYRGVVGAASGAGIAIGAYFAFYGVACNALARHTDLPPTSIAFVGGGIAAVGSSFVKVPLAVCIRSVQAGVYPNFFAAGRSIIAAAGVRGLFTGYAPTVLEDVPDMAIKFAAYESMRQVHRTVYNGRPATVPEDFAMGATAGALAAAATTPLDVIKTNMMCNAASRPTMMGAASLVLQQGGPAALFRGVGARALSNGINSVSGCTTAPGHTRCRCDGQTVIGGADGTSGGGGGCQ